MSEGTHRGRAFFWTGWCPSPRDPMPPVTDEGSPLLLQLVARCPTLDDATSTMEYLLRQGVRRLALAVLDHGMPPSCADSFYVVADEANARRARQLLRFGADVRVGTLGVRATPCVGSVPAQSAHPSSGGGGRWRRRSRPDSGGR